MIIPMISAELLKLSKRRAVVVAGAVLTLGVVLIVMLAPEIYHLAKSATTSPAGGNRGMWRGSILLAFLGSVGAMIVGSAAGTGDLSSGIFRDLVATGRSRWTLFAVRVPGVLLFFIPFLTVSFLVMAGFDVWFSGGGASISLCSGPFPGVQCANELATPTFLAFFHWYLWVLLVTCFDLLLALGLASLVSSRSLTIGVLLAFQIIVAPLLSSVSVLAGLRQVLFTQSFSRLAPSTGQEGDAIHMFGQAVTSSVGTSWIVLVLWILALVVAGAWRTATRDA